MATFAAAFARRVGGTVLSKGRALGSLSPYVFNKVSAGFVAGAIAGMPMMSGEDFFEHRFVTNKQPDDIVDFYSTEDFLQILGIFKIAIHFVLAGVEWDLDKENTMKVHNAMEISFELQEREEETEDGETVVAWFQKKERFKNFIPFTPFLMWDQTQCYGYNRREDGTCEVFHRGENFYGPLPVRLLVQLHARYVIWATEKHINSPAFGSGDLEVQEHQRSNVPMHVFQDFLKRLQLAQQVAIESGKLVAGSDTEKAERALAKIKQLRRTHTEACVEALRKSTIKRHVTMFEVPGDPHAQAAIDTALGSLSKTKEGKAAAAEALEGLMNHPDVRTGKAEIVKEAPRYGGVFNARGLKGAAAEA